MATVDALVDLVADEAGLASGDEAFILARLNAVYARLAIRLELDTTATISVTALDEQVDISASVQIINHVAWRTSAGAQVSLERATIETVFDNRSRTYPPAAGGDGPFQYAFSWPNVLLDPVPGAAGTLVVWGVIAPPTLVRANAVAGQETTPSLIPAAFHEDVLAKEALVRILEGLEGAEERATYHRGLLSGSMAELADWVERSGGRDTPERAHDAWSTSARISAR